MSTKRKQIIDAIAALLGVEASLTDVPVLVNSVLPETIAQGEALIIVREGEPGDPDRILGGYREVYYENHQIEIQLFVADADAATRDALFAAIEAGIGVALEGDLTLGGLVEIMDYGASAPTSEPIYGADDIKEAVLTITAPYFAATPLA